MRTYIRVQDGIARVVRVYRPDADIDDVIAKFHALDRALITSVREIQESDLPATTTLAIRNAWEDDGVSITVNMTKARANTIDRIEPERAARLLAADALLKAAEDASDGQEIARLRQVRKDLRDLPVSVNAEVEALTTPEALEAWEPTWP